MFNKYNFLLYNNIISELIISIICIFNGHLNVIFSDEKKLGDHTYIYIRP